MTADAILLIRPMGGSSAMWGRFRDRLAEQLNVIAYDHRARRSTRALARDAIAVLDRAGVGQVHVFGESLGGMVASWLAIDAPWRVQRLVLASTLPRGIMTSVMTSMKAARSGLEIARCLAKEPHEAARCAIKRLLSEEFCVAHPDEARRIEDAFGAEGMSRRTSLAHLIAAGRHDVTGKLHEVTAPTLVLCGGHDPLLTVSSQRELLGAIRDVTFEVVTHAGHAITLEQPDDAAARVLAFLGARERTLRPVEPAVR